jgi:hypothetical protein
MRGRTISSSGSLPNTGQSLSTLTVMILFPSSLTTTRAFLTSCRSIEKLRSNQYIAFVLISKELGGNLCGVWRATYSSVDLSMSMLISEASLSESAEKYSLHSPPMRFRRMKLYSFRNAEVSRRTEAGKTKLMMSSFSVVWERMVRSILGPAPLPIH